MFNLSVENEQLSEKIKQSLVSTNNELTQIYHNLKEKKPKRRIIRKVKSKGKSDNKMSTYAVTSNHASGVKAEDVVSLYEKMLDEEEE